jgi:hypothetical protein
MKTRCHLPSSVWFPSSFLLRLTPAVDKTTRACCARKRMAHQFAREPLVESFVSRQLLRRALQQHSLPATQVATEVYHPPLYHWSRRH